MTKRLLAGVLAVLAGCGDRGGTPLAPVPPPAAGPSAGEQELEIRPSRVKRETGCVGELLARRTTRLGAQISGRVLEVLVEEGASVKEKQELVKLDTATIELEIAVRAAEEEAAAVARTDAEVQFARVKAMWEKPAGTEPSIPRKQYDDAKTRLDAAVVQLKLKRAEHELAKQKLEDAVIRAPYDGVVTRRFVDPGQPVTSAPVTDLLEVRDVASLDLEFRLPQPMLARIDGTTPLAWDVEGVPGGAGTGTVSRILPDIDPATRTFRCRTAVDNVRGTLRAGLLVQVRVIEESPKEGLFVPASAVVASSAGPALRVLEAGRPAVRPIKAAEPWGEFVEVLEGLSAGEKILVPAAK